MGKKELSYSEAMVEVEKIIKKLNNDELDIDTISVDIKQATELIKLCKSKLKKSEAEITELFETE